MRLNLSCNNLEDHNNPTNHSSRRKYICEALFPVIYINKHILTYLYCFSPFFTIFKLLFIKEPLVYTEPLVKYQLSI